MLKRDIPAALLPLREDLALYPGPTSRDGAPTWTIHDPSNGRFFRIDWPTFEILSRWHLGSPEAIAAALRAETTLNSDPDTVLRVARRLGGHHLLRVSGAGAVDHFTRLARSARGHWGRWLLQNYLFFRIPLFRPEPLLQRLLPGLHWLFTPRFFWFLLVITLFGLISVWQQWDLFTATFIDYLTPGGLLRYALALIIAKSVHELAHALSARHFGCRVPTMGVALLVMWPVLYTETSEVWKLADKRQRLAVSAAGILAELLVAALATFVWLLLDDGPLRGAAFLLATSTWIVTLAINLNPLLRFDGYYILSDLLEIANLQDQAFGMGRWWLRERLFGWGMAPPAGYSPGQRRFLILFAIATWIYRFFLFLGIALLVYHFFFKLLGFFLFVVEIIWFILAPLAREIKVWFHPPQIRANGHAKLSLILILVAITSLSLPWQQTARLPATLRAVRHTTLFPPRAARLVTPLPKVGVRFSQGETLLRLEAPDLEHEFQTLQRQIELLRWQVAARGLDQTLLRSDRSNRGQLAARQREHEALLAERGRLWVTAPFSGTVVAVNEDLSPGAWVAAGEALLTLVDRQQWLVEGFLADGASDPVPGATALFHPEDPTLSAIPARLQTMDRINSQRLREPYLASLHGGDISVQVEADGTLTPRESIYRLLLTPANPPPLSIDRIVRGTVVIDTTSEIPFLRLWRWLSALVIRESGF